MIPNSDQKSGTRCSCLPFLRPCLRDCLRVATPFFVSLPMDTAGDGSAPNGVCVCNICTTRMSSGIACVLRPFPSSCAGACQVHVVAKEESIRSQGPPGPGILVLWCLVPIFAWQPQSAVNMLGAALHNNMSVFGRRFPILEL